MLIEMTIKGLTVDAITNMPIVILRDKDGERTLPIWVGIFEANAIALQMENITTPRPMTHDLLRNLISDLNGHVDRVVVSELKDNTFYAIIYLTVLGERVAVDARPSDAIALALRTRSPILVEESVIDSARTVDFASERVDDDKLQKWLENLGPAELGKYKNVKCRPADILFNTRRCRPADISSPFPRPLRSARLLERRVPSADGCFDRKDIEFVVDGPLRGPYNERVLHSSAQ